MSGKQSPEDPELLPLPLPLSWLSLPHNPAPCSAKPGSRAAGQNEEWTDSQRLLSSRQMA